MLRAIRGAITVGNNDRKEILSATGELLNEIIERNNICHEDIVSMIFTMTPDLNACFPAAKAREMGYTDVPLMCMTEISVPNALGKCIRIMIYINSDKSLGEIKHIYLRNAENLRRDLT